MKKLFLMAGAFMLCALSATASVAAMPQARVHAKTASSYDGTNAIRDVEGTKTLMTKWSLGYFTLPVSFGIEEEMPTQMVVDADGYVYLRNIVTDLPMNSYIKGVKADDRITFTFPQEAGGIQSSADPSVYYPMNYELLEYNKDTNQYTPSTTKRSADFVIGADGAYNLDLGYTLNTAKPEVPKYIIGLTYAVNNQWYGNGDCMAQIKPCTLTALTPPADMTTETWALTSTGSDGSARAVSVQVGFDGDDVWMQGVYPMLPESWTKGTVADGKVTFANADYLGMYNDNVSRIEDLYFVWMVGVNTEDYSLQPMVFDYDAEGRKMTAVDNSTAWCANISRLKAKILEAYRLPEISYIGEVANFEPEAPTMFNFAAPDPATGEGHFTFNFNLANTEGQPLDINKMFVNLMVDGVAETFYTEDYAIAEDMVDIPLNMISEDMKILSMADMGVNMMDLTFYALGYNTIGVKLVYVDGDKRYDSKTLLSDGSYEQGSNSAAIVKGDNGAAVYYDLTGRRVANPAKGNFYIKRTAKGAEKVVF